MTSELDEERKAFEEWFENIRTESVLSHFILFEAWQARGEWEKSRQVQGVDEENAALPDDGKYSEVLAFLSSFSLCVTDSFYKDVYLNLRYYVASTPCGPSSSARA